LLAGEVPRVELVPGELGRVPELALGALIESGELARVVSVPLHRVDVGLLDGWDVGQQGAHHLAETVPGDRVVLRPLLALESFPGRWLAHGRSLAPSPGVAAGMREPCH